MFAELNRNHLKRYNITIRFKNKRCLGKDVFVAALPLLGLLIALEAVRQIGVICPPYIGVCIVTITFITFIGGLLTGFAALTLVAFYIIMFYSIFKTNYNYSHVKILYNLTVWLALLGFAVHTGSQLRRTLHKQMMDQLKISRERYELAISGANDILWDWDIIEGKAYLSSRWEDLLAMGEKNIIEINEFFNKLVHPGDTKLVNKSIKDYLQGKTKVCNIEHRLLAKDGSYIWVVTCGQAVWDKEGKPVRMAGTCIEITHIKRKDMELQRVNSMLKAQQEASIDAILLVDRDRRIISYNQRFIDLWQIPECMVKNEDDKAMLEHAFSLVADGNVFLRDVERLYSSVAEINREKILLKNGCILDRYSAPIVSPDGECIGRVWYFRDITDKEKASKALQKSLEENRRLLKEVMEHDEYKNEFFINISHEFRTPINVLLSMLQLMNLQHSGNQVLCDGEKTKKHIGVMKQNCYRLLKLANNLIDISKMDAGFYEINMCNNNVIEIVEDITLSVAQYIESKGICLQFDTDVEEKVICVDPFIIERIMLNILSNAVKFTDKGGLIKVNIHDLGESVEISIKDTGIGIPEDKIGIVFERFRQVNNSLTRNHEGSGIGLSLVKHLVELHGGSISVKSVYGAGSEFIIHLPFKLLPEGACQNVETFRSRSNIDNINMEFSDIY